MHSAFGRNAMGFEFPWLLLLVVVLLPIVFSIKQGDSANRETLRQLRSPSPTRTYCILRCTFASVFMSSLVLTAAGPYIEPRSTGDYLFLIDTSRSMEARNSCGELTLFQRSKEVVREVLDGVPEGRFGVVAFDRLAFPITPLTYDHSYLEEVLSEALFIGMSYRATGTELGNALSVVARKKQRLPELYGDVRHVILLTDGHMDTEDWKQELEQPLEELQDANIGVLAIGIGNEKETPIPVTTPEGECTPQMIEVNGRTVQIPFRPDIVKFIATETTGRYFGEAATDQLIEFIREKTLFDASNNEAFTGLQRKDIGWLFLIPATIALFGFLLL